MSPTDRKERGPGEGMDEAAERSPSVAEFEAELRAHRDALAMQMHEVQASRKALAVARSGFLGFVEDLPVGVLELDADSVIRYLNPVAARLLSGSHDSSLGMSLVDLVDEADQASLASHLAGVSRGRQRACELTLRGPDGSSTRVRLQGQPAPADRPAGRCLCVIEDVTAMRATMAAVIEREARLRAIGYTTFDAIITISPEGTIRSFNPAAETVFGYSAAAAVGRNVKILMADDVDHDRFLSRAQSPDGVHVLGPPREVMGRRKDGSEVPLRLNLAETHVGGLHMYVGVLHDLSEE